MVRLINITCLVAWVMVLLPALVYLITEWQSRRDQLFGVLIDQSLRYYYDLFYPSKKISKETDLEQLFRSDFARLYGRHHYAMPMILLAVVAGIGMWLTAAKITAVLSASNATAAPTVAITAFLGGYSWVLLDQFGRY